MTHKSIKRRSIKRRSKKKISRRLNWRRKHKMHGGAETSSATINTPTSAPPPASSSDNAANVNANNSSQNSQNQSLAGGSRRKRSTKRKRGSRRKRSTKRSSRHRRKRMRGGMGGVTMCTGQIVNSADGYGYMPPVGCIQVPVLANQNAQSLAINSVHVSATGQANAQYDQNFKN